MEFRHQRIDDAPPNSKMAFCLTTDLTGNGRPDIVIGANGKEELVDVPVLGTVNVQAITGMGVILKRVKSNVFWYENPSWECHEVATAPALSVGGSLKDITGNGRPDLVAGQNIHRHDLWWFEIPDDPREKWTRRLITDDFEKYHDTAVADVDGDGNDEILLIEGDIPYAEDRRARLGVFDQPDWSVTLLHDDLSNPHTLQVADFDGDGSPDVFVAEMGLEPGHDPRRILFRNDGTGTFETEVLGTGIPTHEAKAVDLDGDGRIDIVGKAYTERHVDAWFNEG